jgi:O-acetyl-ADP-ribose deacetylase (regulator of RNase III)
MIRSSNGNLVTADVEALVNTVNTVGVMGKGIALQFKRAFPGMFEDYEKAVKAGEVKLGIMHVWPTGLMAGPKYVINFPTKGHWRAKSKLRDIETGLEDLTRVVRRLSIRSIAVPPLGCGNGGLDWREVEPRISAAFAGMPDVDVLMFPPGRTPKAASMKSRGPRPTMTPGRAALVAIMRSYAEQALANPSLVESQKLMFFLQEAGEPLRLNYRKNLYGPYADNLRHVLKVVEGHYVSGFGDGSASVLNSEPLELLEGASEAAEPILRDHPETLQRIERVSQLTEGFESAYGLELLASVYWIAKNEIGPGDGDNVVLARVRDWSARKGRMFLPEHVEVALSALRQRGWLRELATA